MCLNIFYSLRFSATKRAIASLLAFVTFLFGALSVGIHLSGPKSAVFHAERFSFPIAVTAATLIVLVGYLLSWSRSYHAFASALQTLDASSIELCGRSFRTSWKANPPVTHFFVEVWNPRESCWQLLEASDKISAELIRAAVIEAERGERVRSEKEARLAEERRRMLES